MATVRQHIRIRRSPEDVWKVVSDAGAVASWFPGMATSSLDGDIRACTMTAGVSVREQIVTCDPGLRRFQYRIVEAPMPVDFHLATIDVLDDPDGALVIYGAEIDPGDGSQMTAAFAAALGRLKEILEDRAL